MAGRSRAVPGAVNAPSSRLLGVPLPDIRFSNPGGDGSGLDSDAEAEGRVETDDGAAEDDDDEVSVWAAADAADDALLCVARTQLAEKYAAFAEVRYV